MAKLRLRKVAGKARNLIKRAGPRSMLGAMRTLHTRQAAAGRGQVKAQRGMISNMNRIVARGKGQPQGHLIARGVKAHTLSHFPLASKKLKGKVGGEIRRGAAMEIRRSRAMNPGLKGRASAATVGHIKLHARTGKAIRSDKSLEGKSMRFAKLSHHKGQVLGRDLQPNRFRAARNQTSHLPVGKAVSRTQYARMKQLARAGQAGSQASHIKAAAAKANRPIPVLNKLGKPIRGGGPGLSTSLLRQRHSVSGMAGLAARSLSRRIARRPVYDSISPSLATSAKLRLGKLIHK